MIYFILNTGGRDANLRTPQNGADYENFGNGNDCW